MLLSKLLPQRSSLLGEDPVLVSPFNIDFLGVFIDGRLRDRRIYRVCFNELFLRMCDLAAGVALVLNSRVKSRTGAHHLIRLRLRLAPRWRLAFIRGQILPTLLPGSWNRSRTHPFGPDRKLILIPKILWMCCVSVPPLCNKVRSKHRTAAPSAPT